MITLIKTASDKTVIADFLDIEVINETTNEKAMRIRAPYVVNQTYRDYSLSPFVVGLVVSSEEIFHLPLRHVMFYTSDDIDDRLLVKYSLMSGEIPK